MSIRFVRGAVVLFFLLFTAAVTWPGMTLGNRALPLVLGLPLSMVWIAAWVVLSFLALLALDLSEGRARSRRVRQGKAASGPGASGEPSPAGEGE